MLIKGSSCRLNLFFWKWTQLGTIVFVFLKPHELLKLQVVDHYDNPRNVGSFDKNDPNVGTGLVGAPACGDVMKLQIKVDDKTGEIVDACFKTFGCGSAIASSSVGMFIKPYFLIVKVCCTHTVRS